MVFSNIREYVFEEKFKIMYENEKLDVINYLKVEHFDSVRITISHKNGLVNVLGNKLVINKLLKDELLISGVIEKIELR